ncbi:MAG TPA: RDD family protein [Burkholderiales bacterium]
MAEIAQGTGQVVYVGFWKRFAAMWIDTLILTVVIALIVLPIYGSQYPALKAQGQTMWIDNVINVGAILATILLWRFRGATPGKMLFSAKIVDANTLAAPSMGKLVGRFFAYLVSMIPLGLGFLWIAFDARKQGWHDKLAGTVVIEEPDA